MSFDSVKVEKLREFVAALESGEIEGIDTPAGKKLARRVRLQIDWLDGKISYEEARQLEQFETTG